MYGNMDTLKGRKIATHAMLPNWEGFCEGGEQMTALEAVEQIQNVWHCMTKSRILSPYALAKNSMPRDYDFCKVRISKVGLSEAL